ncbi:MAG: hypothetical protein WA151_09105, partial [Desulfatirhabdiaceae bacterium]
IEDRHYMLNEQFSWADTFNQQDTPRLAWRAKGTEGTRFIALVGRLINSQVTESAAFSQRLMDNMAFCAIALLCLNRYNVDSLFLLTKWVDMLLSR